MLQALLVKKLNEGTFIQIIAVFICAASFVTGTALSIEIYQTNMGVQNFEGKNFVYTIIGGVTVAWIGMHEVIKRFKDLK